MIKRQVFYSFHYEKDVMRVQQIRNIGAIEENKPVSSNNWESIKRNGDSAVEAWIDENMKYRSCVIVLVGEETANRKWVKYEIVKAWNDGKGLLGIHINNLKDPRYGTCQEGKNPFEQFILNNKYYLSNIVKCYKTKSLDAYNDIANNLEAWIEEAIRIRECWK